MGIFSKPPFNSDKRREFPEGLWQKCPSCGEMIHNLELVQNFRVCPKCDHHFTQSARERLDMLLDPKSFEEHDARMVSVDTLKFTGMDTQLDFWATVNGGGVGGQSGAIRMGLSRALAILNPDLRPGLRKNGFLTRDSRMRERKKYGQKGARKRFQFSKR